MLLYRELDGSDAGQRRRGFPCPARSTVSVLFRPKRKSCSRIVPLRRLAARLGAEKVFLKGGRMSLFFVSNPDSPLLSEPGFRQSHRLHDEIYPPLRPARAERLVVACVVKDVTTVEDGSVGVLQEIVAMQVEE